MDLGASRRGVDMGPSALRVAGLQARLKQLGRQVEDIGNIPVKQPEEQHYGEKNGEVPRRNRRNLQTAWRNVAENPRRRLTAARARRRPFDRGRHRRRRCRHFHKQSKRIGLIWLDAHGDMNTPETSPSGNVHGMPLASIMGYGPPELTDLAGIKPMVEPRNVALVGIRELDSKERRLIKDSGVHVFTMRDIDERGMREVMTEALRFAGDDTAGIAVSLDMDFVDPTDAPGVGTPVRGGVTYREAHLAMEMIADSEIDGLARGGGDQSGDRPAQYDRAARRRTGSFGIGQEDSVRCGPVNCEQTVCR